MRRGRDERGEGAADGKARPIFSGGERSEACDSRRRRVQKLEPRAHSVESSRVVIIRSLAPCLGMFVFRITTSSRYALSAASAGTSPPRRVARIAFCRAFTQRRRASWKQPPCLRVREESAEVSVGEPPREPERTIGVRSVRRGGRRGRRAGRDAGLKPGSSALEKPVRAGRSRANTHPHGTRS